MIIHFAPCRMDDTLVLEVAGDTLTLNGEVLDFSQLGAGEDLPTRAVGNRWIVGPPIKRTGGQIELTVIAPHGSNPSEAQQNPPTVTLLEGRKEMP